MEWMFMPLRRYAEFSGRSRRMEYWMFALFQFLLFFVFWALMIAVAGSYFMTGDLRGIVAAGGAIMILCAVFGLIWLALLVPAIAVGVRRLHDTNRSGWWLLAPVAASVLTNIVGRASNSLGSASAVGLVGSLITLVLSIVVIVFMLLDGTRGPNRFGDDPKGAAHQEVFA
jgi:uncharacterized membrane protein YhaH (DUF805 family)